MPTSKDLVPTSKNLDSVIIVVDTNKALVADGNCILKEVVSPAAVVLTLGKAVVVLDTQKVVFSHPQKRLKYYFH